MKPLFLLTLIILGFTAHADNKPIKAFAGPIADAGPDQTIYLTQTSSVTLNGSASSGDSYQWTDISSNIGYPMLMNLGVEGHPVNTGTLSNATLKVATVTGLSQGVWYYQIAVTTGGATHYDTMVVRVKVQPDPTGTLLRGISQAYSAMLPQCNGRADTTTSYGVQGGRGIDKTSNYTFPDSGPTDIYYDQGRSNDMYIDTMRAKIYTVVEDGYQWGHSGFTRTELNYNGGYGMDSTHTYCYQWQGYYPQDFSNLAPNLTGATIMQLHGHDDYSPVFSFAYINGHDGANTSVGTTGLKALYFQETDASYHDKFYYLCDLSTLVNQTHTFKLIFKEGKGYPGQDAFVEVKIDGVVKYYRNTGDVGRIMDNSIEDYPKFLTIYDSNNSLVDASNHTRNRKFAMVTEEFNIYSVTDTTESSPGNQPPKAKAGSDQTITLPTNSVNLDGSGTDSDGSISSYLWAIISGPSGSTIGDPSSASTTVSGLKEGTYQFQLKVTDNDGATGTATMLVTVNSSTNKAPTAKTGSNQTITLPTNSASISGSGTDPDGAISSYLWTKISGPSGSTIADPNSASTTVSGLGAGVYQFQLQVTDNNGATGTAMMQVTVNSASNIAPIAKTGTDQTITLPTNSVSITGSGTDSDGNIVSYLWKKKLAHQVAQLEILLHQLQ